MNHMRLKFSRSRSSRNSDSEIKSPKDEISKLFSFERSDSLTSPISPVSTSTRTLSDHSPKVPLIATPRKENILKAFSDSENESEQVVQESRRNSNPDVKRVSRRAGISKSLSIEREISVENSQFPNSLVQLRNKGYTKSFPSTPRGSLRTPRPRASTGSIRFPKINKKAVLVAATYAGTRGVRELKSSTDAISEMYRVLVNRAKFNADNLFVLTDDPKGVARCNNSMSPTRGNILNAMTWLVGGAKEGDILIFVFIGHTVQDNRQMSEKGGKIIDCLLPVDYPTAAPISDSQILSTLICGLPCGTNLTTIFDCAHPALLLKLPFVYVPKKEIEKIVLEDITLTLLETSDTSRIYGGSLMARRHRMKECSDIKEKIALEKRNALARSLQRFGNVVSISSHSESADLIRANRQAISAGVVVKALANIFQNLISRNRPASYKKVMYELLSALTTTPDAPSTRLSTSHQSGRDTKFPL